MFLLDQKPQFHEKMNIFFPLSCHEWQVMGPKEVYYSYLVPEMSFMKIGCLEVLKPTYSLLWLAEWKVPAPLKWWLVSETPMPSLHYRAVLSRYWYFCLRHSWDSWGCGQNYNHIQGQKIAWHHHELLNKISCRSWSIKSIMLIMVIIMNC